MIVPTKVIKKEENYEIVLMVFPIFRKEETVYEFTLVKSSQYEKKTLKVKEYVTVEIEKIAKEFNVKIEDVNELLEKLDYKIR